MQYLTCIGCFTTSRLSGRVDDFRADAKCFFVLIDTKNVTFYFYTLSELEELLNTLKDIIIQCH